MRRRLGSKARVACGVPALGYTKVPLEPHGLVMTFLDPGFLIAIDQSLRLNFKSPCIPIDASSRRPPGFMDHSIDILQNRRVNIIDHLALRSRG